MTVDMNDRGRRRVERIRLDERKRLSARVNRICRAMGIPAEEVARYLEFARTLQRTWPGVQPA